ncbi:CAP domain-containing protein [Kineococcus gynurae]|uniref:CAP domain-containing protein n=1 Tax=Kineococcus gynurae TaxID=452979 RepID=A0ABV5LST2_9ACTN
MAAATLGGSAVVATPAQAEVPFGTGPTAVPLGVQDGDWPAHFRTRVLLDQVRADAGLAPLGWAPDTDRVAGDWAWEIARRGVLQHNQALRWRVEGYRLYAENVGYGGDADQIMRAFLDSRGHRQNILNPAVDTVGVGAVRSADGRLWIVEVFKDTV